ncbi:unnamed protein product [Malus baccata var. baccata]
MFAMCLYSFGLLSILPICFILEFQFHRGVRKRRLECSISTFSDLLLHPPPKFTHRQLMLIYHKDIYKPLNKQPRLSNADDDCANDRDLAGNGGQASKEIRYRLYYV